MTNEPNPRQCYTLEHPLYLEGLVGGCTSEKAFSDGRRTMIVGGGATQLTARRRPSLLRPTTDVDFIFDSHNSRPDRKAWANYLADYFAAKGYKATGSKTSHGAEVRFSDISPDLLLHLDCVGASYFKKQESRIKAEYERATNEEIKGINVRYQGPIDIIANKVARIEVVNRDDDVLNPSQVKFLDSLKAGAFDDIEIGDLTAQVSSLSRRRMANLEDLGRVGYGKIVPIVKKYKISKDLYDISLVIDIARENGMDLHRGTFLSHLSSILSH